MAAINPTTTNTRTGSTTWEQVPDRMRRSRREGHSEASPQASFTGLSKRNPRDRLTVSITYRGGAEGWWLVEARGRRQAFPSSWTIHEVMTVVNQARFWKGRPQ